MPIPKAKKAGIQPEPAQLVLSPEIDYGLWEEQTVVVTFEDGKKDKYDCKVYGQMCVMHSWIEPDKWIVLHKDTWLAMGSHSGGIMRVATEDDALRIGAFLWEQCMMAWMRSTREELHESLPAWVQQYCEQCRVEGKYVDPTPFID